MPGRRLARPPPSERTVGAEIAYTILSVKSELTSEAGLSERAARSRCPGAKRLRSGGIVPVTFPWSQAVPASNLQLDATPMSEISETLKHEAQLNKEQIREEDRVPLGQKIAYAMGVVSDHYATVCLTMFVNAFFVDFLKLGASIVGYAQGVARCWDAFTDPLVGSLSDRCKSRFGRRKPFVFAGAVLTGLCFPLIWLVPEHWSSTAITVYLFAALLAFYSCYSIFSVPYEALGAELTADYKERSQIFVVRSYVQQVFNLGIIWIFPFAMFLATKSWIGGEVNGVRAVSVLIALVIITAGIIPAIFCVERYRNIAEKEGRGAFWTGVKALVRNKPLLIVIGTICTYLFSIIATMNLSYFVNVYYIYEGKIQAGAVLGGIDGTLRFFISIAAAWGIKKLSDRFDKHHLMMACVTILLIAFVGTYFTTLPGRPWLSLAFKPLIAIGEVGFWVLILSMRADVCDWDEYKTNKRNEGLIAAMTNWVNKIAITLAVVVSGLLLQYVVRFDSSLPEETKARIEIQAEAEYEALPEEKKQGEDAVTLDQVRKELEQKAVMEKQEPGTMARLRLFYTMPQVVALIVCLILLSRYPLSHARMKEIRGELEARRGKAVG